MAPCLIRLPDRVKDQDILRLEHGDEAPGGSVRGERRRSLGRRRGGLRSMGGLQGEAMEEEGSWSGAGREDA
jgi:hypothetical protein